MKHLRKRTDFHLKMFFKARQQAEYESRLLRQELQQISSTLNEIQKYRFPKQATDPISLNITLKY